MVALLEKIIEIYPLLLNTTGFILFLPSQHTKKGISELGNKTPPQLFLCGLSDPFHFAFFSSLRVDTGLVLL